MVFVLLVNPFPQCESEPLHRTSGLSLETFATFSESSYAEDVSAFHLVLTSLPFSNRSCDVIPIDIYDC